MTHPVILILVLVAAFLAFAFHPGSLVDIMRLGYILYLVHWVTGNCQLSCLTRAHLILFMVMLVILLLTFTVPAPQIHSSTLSHVVAIPGLVLVCHLLSYNLESALALALKKIGLGALTVAVAGQLMLLLVSPATEGAYENVHHLGLFAGVCIFVAGYFATASSHPGRWIAWLAGTAAFYLLWESGSRISWLAFFLSAILMLIAVPNKKHSLALVIIIAGITVITAGISGFDTIGSRINDLINGWRSEERVYIWRDAAALMKQNTSLDWIRGRGIGSFRYFIKDYPGLSIANLEAPPTFPHNVGIQVLFENGIVGLILIFGGFAAWVRLLWRGIRRNSSIQARHLYALCFAVFWIVIFHTLLTKSIYSKYIVYLISMVAGISFALGQREGHRKGSG
jgi:O-antigen ligase